MGILFFYDTETSGLPLFSEPSDDPRQPHIVEAAALLVDTNTRQIIDEYEAISRPDGWEIPDEVAAIHGITTIKASQYGIPEDEVVARLHLMWQRADVGRVAHNETFDARILRIGIKRFMPGGDIGDAWKNGRALCTAKGSTKILNLPPTAKMVAAGRMHPKTPNLAEAYRHFTGEDFQDAHRAMADVKACLRIHWGIVDHYDGAPPAPKPKTAKPAPAARPAPAPVQLDDDGVGFLS